MLDAMRSALSSVVVACDKCGKEIARIPSESLRFVTVKSAICNNCKAERVK